MAEFDDFMKTFKNAFKPTVERLNITASKGQELTILTEEEKKKKRLGFTGSKIKTLEEDTE